MSDAALGALILVPLVVVIYVVARVVSTVGDAWGARLLAPLAPAIGGEVSPEGPTSPAPTVASRCASRSRRTCRSDPVTPPTG